MPCLLTNQNFANSFWKGSPKEHFYEIISKSDNRFQRRRISLKSTQCKKPPRTAAMFFDRSKFREQFLKMVTQEQSCEIISKSDKWFQRRRIFMNFSEVHIVKKASPNGVHVFRRIKISRTNFENGHTRNNPVKFFRILTSGSGEEDFLRISSCPYSAKIPPPPRPPCFSTDQTCERNNPVKLFQNLTCGFRGEEFWRISLKSTHWKKPPPIAAMFFDGSKFCEQFWKGPHKEQSCEMILNSDQRFRRRRFFKNFYMSI